MIRIKAINLEVIFFLLFLLILPTFGKVIDYQESLLFFSIPSLFLIYLITQHHKIYCNKAAGYLIGILAFLYILSVVFSLNISTSYYQLFIFITVVITLISALSLINSSLLQKGLIVAALSYSLIFLLEQFLIISLPLKPFSDNFILRIWGHSYMADFLILPILYIYSNPDNLLPGKFRWILLSVLLFTLFLTNSRSGLIAVLVGLFILTPKKISFKVIPLLFIIASLIIINTHILGGNDYQKSVSGSRLIYWQEAYTGFLSSPLIGVGPGNFFVFNQKLSQDPSSNSNYSHNFVLGYLCENGILFTGVLMLLIFLGLKGHFIQKNWLQLAQCSSLLVLSLLDPALNSPAILVLFMYFLLTDNYFFLPQDPEPKIYKKILFIIPSLVLIFFISKTTSDILFAQKQYRLSALTDYFNPNPRLELIKTDSTLIQPTQVLNQNQSNFYHTVTANYPINQYLSFYQKAYLLDPQASILEFAALVNYYANNGQHNNLAHLLTSAPLRISDQYLNRKNGSIVNLYQKSLTLYPTDPQSAILLLKYLATNIPQDGYLQVEYANALWHNHETNAAKTQLLDCQKNPLAARQCQVYLENKTIQGFDSPGIPDAVEYIAQTYQ